jgi:hypothetical protein
MQRINAGVLSPSPERFKAKVKRPEPSIKPSPFSGECKSASGFDSLTAHAFQPARSFCLFPLAERSHSGLVHRSRKPEWVNAHRGFESHPLRSFSTTCRRASHLRVPGFWLGWRAGGAFKFFQYARLSSCSHPFRMICFPSSRLSTASLSLTGTPCA